MIKIFVVAFLFIATSNVFGQDISKTIHEGKQGKHILGHNNYKNGRSILKLDAQSLLDAYHSNNIESKQKINEYKVRVDFGKVIGICIDSDGNRTSTENGIIHSSKKGAHIVPSKPN